jgi:RNA polymerase sigma-70 factor (ECF subfamily)
MTATAVLDEAAASAYTRCGMEPAASADPRAHALLALIRRMAAGEESALAALYDETSAMVHGLAVRILRDEALAEDVTIEVYMQAFRQASSYDAGRGTPLGWLLTLARSRAIDRFRVAARQQSREEPLDTIDTAPTSGPDPIDSTLTAESRRVVLAALAGLTPEQRRPIELAYYAGMSQSEIATALGQPLGTIKTRIRTGMLALRDALRPLRAELQP